MKSRSMKLQHTRHAPVTVKKRRIFCFPTRSRALRLAMAGEKKIENAEVLDAGLKSDSCRILTEQKVASVKDGVSLDSGSTISSLGNIAATMKGEADQESAAEQGVYHPPTSFYNYYYPAYSGAFDDPAYLQMGDRSFAGVLSDNGSMFYYLPGYDPFVTGTFMGIDGQCVGQQPYYSPSGCLQHPVSYGAETVPCYSWNTAYVGDGQHVTISAAGDAKSGSGPISSANLNKLNSKPNGSLGGKLSTLPLDPKFHQFAVPSNFSKSSSQPLKPFNKVPQFASGIQSAGLVKGFHPVGKFSSFSCQKQGLFPCNGSMNHRQNGRIWNGNDRFKMREKPHRNEQSDTNNGMTCGPRGNNMGPLFNTFSPEKKQLVIPVQRDQYNLPDFQIEFDDAKFFVIKSYSEDDIHKSIKYDVWSSTVNGNKKLDAAFHDSEIKKRETGTRHPIFLFYSVNASGQFVGVAEMLGKVDFNKDMDFWQLDKWNGFFPVKWHIIKDVPNSKLRHILLENNDNRAVTFSRDSQEKQIKSGETRIEDGTAKRASDPASALIDLTRNLSLSASPLKSSIISPIEKFVPPIPAPKAF
ncbi:YTH domain [Dillenia turbinata]|uniref:YTH domain-containing family protein n=1 Tax=Dillenia turbinata TaxID=194707 RepID=A0AAN8YWY1_9MAGN